MHSPCSLCWLCSPCTPYTPAINTAVTRRGAFPPQDAPRRPRLDRSARHGPRAPLGQFAHTATRGGRRTTKKTPTSPGSCAPLLRVRDRRDARRASAVTQRGAFPPQSAPRRSRLVRGAAAAHDRFFGCSPSGGPRQRQPTKKRRPPLGRARPRFGVCGTAAARASAVVQRGAFPRQSVRGALGWFAAPPRPTVAP